MESQAVNSAEKNGEYGITLVDNVGQFLNGSSIIYNNVTVNMGDMVGTVPLPSIQSWLYPSPISTSEINSCASPITSITEALQQITSGLVQSEGSEEIEVVSTTESSTCKDDGQNLSVYQLNCNVLELPSGVTSCKTGDKANDVNFDIDSDTRILTTSTDSEAMSSLTENEISEAPVSPVWHTVPVDLLRLLRGENVTLQTEVDGVEDVNNNTEIKPRRKSYKVLTTVATQTVPESELLSEKEGTETQDTKPLREQNGKSKLESCRYLYQFLEAMLSDPRYAELIKWRNKQERTFTLLDHNRVAHLWGVHKRKKSMTYDKFSRALRFYYSKNILRKESARFTYRFLTKEGSKLPF